ncbi:UDP-galactopyranose mutase [Streptococcus suis]|nr:UDP-galactopyranose mutase [Streptococcus suis]CYX74717.1 UDP-galactopyranose mutase [Streptococcus suis]
MDHENIGVETNVDFFVNKEDYLSDYPKVVFTGMIDEFFDYQLGELEYRSLRFETEVLDMENYQGNAVVNYTDSETLSNTNISNSVHKRKPLLHVSIRRPGNEALSRIIQ